MLVFSQLVFRRWVFHRPVSSHLASSLFVLACECRRSVCLGLIVVIAWHFGSRACADDPGPQEPRSNLVEQEKFFESRVRPLLVQHCVECHGPDDQSGELRLDRQVDFRQGGSSGPVVVAGDPDASRLIRAIGYQDNELQMPPDSKLPDEAVAIFTQWVRSGAFWPEGEPAAADQAVIMSPAEQIDAHRESHWSFRPIVSTEPPAIEPLTPLVSADKFEPDGHDTISAIDRFVLARLSQAELAPNPRADRRDSFTVPTSICSDYHRRTKRCRHS